MRFYDVTDSLSRAVAYAEYLTPQDIATVAEIIINGLQESTKEENTKPSGPWAQLGNTTCFLPSSYRKNRIFTFFQS